MDNFSKNILLVEDEVIIAMNEVEFLKDFGYVVVHVTTGEEAINFALNEENAINLILFDIDLGHGIDGPTAAKIILEKKDIPIIFLSSHTEPDFVKKTEEITSYGYIAKNTAPVVIDASIKMAFRLHNAKTQIKEAKDDWKNVFNAICQLGMILDPDYKILKVNKATMSATGLTEEELIGKKCFEIFHNSEKSPHDCPMKKLIKTGSSDTMEMKVEAVDGSFLVSCTPIYDNSGQLLKVIHMATDITKRKISEKELETMKSVVENSTDAIGMSNTDGVHYYQNKSFDQLFGKIGQHPDEEIYVSEDIGRKIFSEIKNGKTWIGEVKMYSKDREIHDILLRAFANKDRDGNILSLVGIHTDITEKNKIENQLTENENKFYKQSILLETIFDAIPDVIGVQNIDHSIVRYNKAGYDFLNLLPDDCLNKKCFEFLGNDKECKKCATSEVYKTKKPAMIEKYLPEIKSWLDIRAYPVLDEHGNLINVIEHLRDITVLKKNEERINNELTQKEILLKEVHHRIKNNIGAIISFLKLNLSQSENIEARSTLQEAINQVESIFQIYENLLITGDYQELPVEGYLTKLISQIKYSFPQKENIEIIIDIGNFEMDVKRLFLIGVIVNELMVNSMKYAFPKNKGEININFEESENELILKYSDTGKGLAKDFDIDQVRSLGFTLIKMMSQQLDGDLKINNQNGFNLSISFPF